MKPIMKVGAFGGKIGVAWDDGSHTSIRKIILYSGNVVDSIQIEYLNDGLYEISEMHGTGEGSKNVNEINLEPDEYITSISGYHSSYVGSSIIFSLRIESNERKFGPFGTEKGEHFFVPSTIGKIVGLFGRHTPYIVSIGAYVEPNEPLIKTIGPFGGEGGVFWDDGRYTAVRSLTVVSDSAIKSIIIEYDNDGSSAISPKHGGSDGGGKTDVVELDYPGEFVNSISGYHSTNHSSLVVVQSLTVQTNRRAYGPFGMEKGKYFSLPSSGTGGKVVGFHGKCGAYLDSVGVYLEPNSNFYMVKTVGPFGGDNGRTWDDKTHAGIKQIRVVQRVFISTIHTEYHDDDESSSVSFPPHSNDDDGDEHKVLTIKLDFPDEFLTSVTGYITEDDLNDTMISSLTFQSNRRTYGPIGPEQGKYFSFPSFNGKIVGFHGKSWGILFSIGAHIGPIPYPMPSQLVGPFGSRVGDLWDDGIHNTIKQLIITCGSTVVNSICIEYEKNGHSVWSPKHGESVGDKLYRIKLDYPYEFLTSLSGYCSPIDSDSSSSATIQSLTIKSNKKTYGPFGRARGNREFSTSSACGKIIGFHGRASGDHVNSIGVYLKPFPPTFKYEFIESLGGQGGYRWDDGAHTTIRQLVIGAGFVVNSIRIEYDHHGQSVWSRCHGETEGGNKYMVKLNYPAEYLVSMSGYYNPESSYSCIQSLTFQTNIRRYGPFGTKQGTRFSVPSSYSGCRIIGFHGTTYHYLRSIGAYMELPEVLGPFGGRGGGAWDDGVSATIRQIQLTVQFFGIESIRFEYDRNGNSVWSEKHGSKDEGKLEKILLDYPTEFLTSVSGTYGQDHGTLLVQSLTFRSNMKTYGPFGLEKGIQFSLSSGGSRIIGFHGRSGFYLDSIGAYVDPATLFYQ